MFVLNIILCALGMCFIENVHGKETTAAEDTVETHPNVNLLPKSCGDISGRRIFGGNVAIAFEFPWMALISYKTGFSLSFDCSGTIINSKYILTAGHCATPNKRIAGVRIGEYDVRYKTDCYGEEPELICESHLQDIRVEKIILHQNYSRYPDPQNDIALLRLEKTIDFNYKNAGPVCLPITQELRNVTLAGMTGIVAGWGLTEYKISSPVLLKVQILIHSDEDCRNLIYKSSTGESKRVLKEICAGENQKDSCSGDSGGPLMVEGEYDDWYRYIQYGVVSRGPRDCGSEPGIYTDVSKYVKWILDNMKE